MAYQRRYFCRKLDSVSSDFRLREFLERVGGTKTGVLPDFFIGAHAAVSRLPLLTRDIRRYRTYFPAINLIAPGTDPR